MIYGYCTNAAFYLSQKLNVGAGNDVGLCIGKNQAIRYIVIFLILGKPPQYKNTRGGNDDRIESVHLVVWSLNVAQKRHSLQHISHVDYSLKINLLF